MNNVSEIETSSPNDGIKYWLNELDEAKKRTQKWHKEGQRIINIYKCSDTNKVPFNILYSNTDTILPALYSAIPRPVIKQRYKDEDTTAQAAATAGERLLVYLLDTNMDGYETFHSGMENAVIDALLPGRGVTRIKYDAEIDEYEPTDNEEQALVKQSELVCVDSIAWDKVLFGYAKKWSKVPWIAFEEVIDKEEAIRLFGKSTANKIKFVKEGDDDDDYNNSNKKEDEHQGGRKIATIYQIWDKDGGKKVRYVSRHYKDDYLKVDDDPLELTGFYPIPKPLTLVASSNDLEVTPPYSVYEEQAKELNEVTRRRTRVLKAIKAKGIYDSELGGDIENLMTGDDNTLIPADKSAVLSDKGFENSIWFMPIEQLIKVYIELTNAQASIKQIIYEITGISDIIRGSTVASETATAQNIKSQWGTMRLKRNQGEVQRYARDLLRLMLEIAATKFSEKTWMSMTGLNYTTDQQVQQAQMIMKTAEQVKMQMAANPQFQVSPQAMQAYQHAQTTLQQPQWTQVLDVLKNDMQRSYRIDIETNSTIIPEATEDKQNMNEALQALSSFIKESLPVVQAGLLPFDSFKSVLLKIVRQFQFGEEVQDEIKSMSAPTPPAPPVDNSLQIKQMDIQAKQASEQMTHQIELQKEANAKEIEQGKAMLQVNMDKLKRQDLQGQAMLDVQMERMRLENDKYIENIKIASAERMSAFKATLDARTKMAIAKLQLLHTDEESLPTDEEVNDDKALDIEAQQMQQIQQAQFAELMACLNKPKTIVRDKNGFAISIH